MTQILHHTLLQSGEQSLVLYGRGERTEDPGTVRIGTELLGKINGARAKLTGYRYNGCELETTALIHRLKREAPDVVHLQCINGNFVNIHRLISFLKERQIPTVLTLHAEFMYTANCSHAFDCLKWETGCGDCPSLRSQTHSVKFDRTAQSWRQMELAFQGFDTLSVVPVSPWQESRAARSPFFQGKRIRTILNGVDTSVFHPIRALPNDPVRRVLYVTPNFDPKPGHNKGGEYLYPLAALLGTRFKIIAVGPGNWGLPPSNVELIGPVYDRLALARLYAEADVTLLTSRRETFSLITAESLCCGTPVVGFSAGGPESIAISKYSRFCPHGQLDAIYDAICNLPSYDRFEIAAEAERLYGKDRMIREYLDEYEKVRKYH